MSFKLLAIRPLEGTDPSLLKGLKPNCIYRFYNEYDYLYDYDENTKEGKSFIELQDIFFQTIDSKRESINTKLKNEFDQLNNYEEIKSKLKEIIKQEFQSDEFEQFIVEKEQLIDRAFVNDDSIDQLKIFALEFFNKDVLTTPKGSCESIRVDKKLPDDFFGGNINVSAIVGENGSGKSSLLELFYYTIVVISRKFNVLEVEEKDDKELMKRLNPLVNVEFYYRDNEEIFGNEKFNKISVSYTRGENDLLNYDVKFSSFEINSYKTYFEVEGGADETDLRWKDFTFYSNVLNYSMYALNSNISPWLHDIFHKNDGYQTPIVLNPFKNKGNNDVNIESKLTKNRGVFFVYALDFKEIIKGLYIHSVYFEVNVNKSIYIDDYSNRLIIEMFDDFFDKTFIGDFEDFVSVVFGENNNIDITLNDIQELFNVIKEPQLTKVKRELKIEDLDSLFKEVKTYKVLNFLYVFKKLYKITRVYKNYRQFKFLFEKKLSFEIVFDNSSSVEESLFEVKRFLSNSVVNENDSHKIIIEIIYEAVVRNIRLISNTGETLLEDELFYILESFMGFYATVGGLVNKYFDDLIPVTINANNSITNLTVKKLNDRINKIVVNLFNGNEFRNYLFYKYVDLLNRDKSHITFKLNQAKKYYSLNIFNALDIDNLRFENKGEERFVIFDIDKDYFKENNSNDDISKIERVPNAFFDSNMFLVKTDIIEEKKRNELAELGILKPFNFDSLSSGEQHIINSMFTVAYHVYNLASIPSINSNKEKINDDKKVNDDKVYNIRKYNNINLIFDELELYLHPEYQRSYLYNMIDILKRVKEKAIQEQLQFNLLFATHSPFILSDIPSQNVLKLKEGKPIKGDEINSFGANIHDLLADEFFLKNGFMGEFAKGKISSVVDFLTLSLLEAKGERSKEEEERINRIKSKVDYVEYTKENCRLIIDAIGEPMLRYSVEELYDSVFKLESDIHNIEVEIKRLEERKNKLTNQKKL